MLIWREIGFFLISTGRLVIASLERPYISQRAGIRSRGFPMNGKKPTNKEICLTTKENTEVGIEIVPVKELAEDMSSGVSYFEQFVWDLEQRGVSDIDIPVLILGVAP